MCINKIITVKLRTDSVIFLYTVFLGKKAEFKPRNYQVELARPAKAGNNTVICAPTNSGKTYVAIAITKTYLTKPPDGKDDKGMTATSALVHPRKPVLFIVNKVNLVLQQRQRFDYYLSDRYSDRDSILFIFLLCLFSSDYLFFRCLMAYS